MKLGTQTGSLINHVATHGQADPMPSLGDGATVFSWSDRHAYTVIMVDVVGGIVMIQEDTATRTDKNGMSDAQSYDFTPNPDGRKLTYKLDRKSGNWFPVRKNPETGRWKRTGKPNIRFGARSRYYDFSF